MARTFCTLFSSDAIPNVMYVALRQAFYLQPKANSRRIRMADGTKAHVLEEVEDVPIKIEEITKRLACFIFSDAPFNLILGCPAMKTL